MVARMNRGTGQTPEMVQNRHYDDTRAGGD